MVSEREHEILIKIDAYNALLENLHKYEFEGIMVDEDGVESVKRFIIGPYIAAAIQKMIGMLETEMMQSQTPMIGVRGFNDMYQDANPRKQRMLEAMARNEKVFANRERTVIAKPIVKKRRIVPKQRMEEEDEEEVQEVY